ncbi:proprotein convertase subtilisin/kexin type 5 [Electrophorus electricus]|uniref:proprotein convertase subtilisin/kexin type 5 n=1 Tax=Electrophorus electricus TaxID=8005 RepID=UPI0015D0AF6E|nr:proprotein convertase subtilisin/kexin type 5 [Electrophorus electricus]
MHRGASVRTPYHPAKMTTGALFRYTVYFGIIFPFSHMRMFTNNWAVRISGGHEHADAIAEKYGFVNMGQVGGLRDYYHFLHRDTIKRSPIASQGNHSLIATESQVEWIQQQMVQRRVKRTETAQTHSTHFNDPQWDSMWYIHCDQNCPTDMNIKAAWRRGYTGKGVVVSILDDGVERQHPDLKQNYDAQASHDVNGNDPDPTPRYDSTNENKHGTRCAGVVAASANNSLCMVGIAYNARIGGVRMLDGDMTDMVEAQSLSLRQKYIDIYSSSWGPDDDGKTVDGPGPLARLALENGIRKGRKGRGSIFVWASGNGGRSQDHCSCDGYTNSIYTISLSSTTQSGHKPWYLEECSSTLASTYSSGESHSQGIVTTDLRRQCTDQHSGTSASAPMAAAIIALTLEANPLLTWRDVQHIIVRTSRRGHLSAPDWQSNGAGYDVSHLYGFGLMDAGAMVKEAETWRQVPTQHVCEENTGQDERVISPERVLRLVYKSSGCAAQRGQHVAYLEHVVVRITITHPHRGDLSITLTSPSGTTSQLLAVRPNDHSAKGFRKWEFMTTHCWGEKATGDWILGIRDLPSLRRNTQRQGKLLEWTLVIYGTSGHPYERHEQPRSAEMSSDYNSEEYNSSCDPECSEDGCDGPGPLHCFSCLNNVLRFKNGTRTCLSHCPQGFWSDRKRCRKCFPSCATCTGSLANQCSSCEAQYYLDKESSSCVTSCRDGYYTSHEEKLCRKCSESCVKCTSPTVCTECPQGTSLMGNRCRKTCEPGTFYDESNNACEPCHEACATCAAAGIESCNRCAVGYLMEEWKCVSSCSQGFYLMHSDPARQTQSSCRRCDPSCLECVGPGKGNCSACLDWHSLHNGACVLIHDCSTGEYRDDSGNCWACDRTCHKCKGPQNDDCIWCSASRWLDEGQCVAHCPKGKYKSSGQCHVCDHTCGQCMDAGPASCTSCDKDKFGQDRYLYAGQCLVACPEAHFSTDHKTCEPCSEHCRLCSSATRCLECKSSYYLNQGSCTQLECGEGEVKDPEYNECMACEEGCKTCVLYNPKHCLSCIDGYYKYEEGCYRHCPAKTYTVEDTMSCVACQQDCISCDEEECHWCETDLFLSDGMCMQECPEGFYGDENTQKCEKCHKDCQKCSGPGDEECVRCRDGLVLSSGECAREQESCPEKTYLTDDGECEACHSSCEVCWGSQRNQCRACISGRYMNADDLCVTRCPMGTFGSKKTGHCEPCAQGCAMCQDQQHCTRCLATRKSALYLQDGQCVRQCFRGYPAGTVCKSCAAGCASCEQNATHCLSCDQPLLLHRHECVEMCPPAHSLHNEECVACPQDCRQCSEEDQCTECNDITFLYDGECISVCPDGYFKHTEQHMCMRCHSDCKLCDSPGPNNCDSCNDPDSTLQDGACVTACPPQTYRDSRSEECMMCHGTCQTCSGPLDTDCLSCSEGLRADAYKRCATPTTCPSHHYSDHDGECHLCHRQCHQCSGPELSQCLSCYAGHFLNNGTCVKSCPTGFFGGETQKCEPCHPNCMTCIGRRSYECLSCRAHLYRNGRECVETCRPNHYADMDSRVCERCDESCRECEGADADSCLSCRDDLLFVRKQSHCVSSCPDLHYHNVAYRSCEPCHATCNSCTGKGEQDCSSCHHGYTLTEGTCESHCDVGEYPTDKEQDSNCNTCDESCLACKGPGPQNCTVCPESFILTGWRCLACCLNEEAGEEETSVQDPECCNCTQTTGECVLITNFAFRNHEEEEQSGNLAIFVTTTILLVGALVTLVVMLFKRSTSKKPPPDATVARGYEKLGHGGAKDRHHGRSMTSSSSTYGGQASSSSGHFQEAQLVDLSDGQLGQGDDEDDEDEVDEDIVYMGQDGTVYRKFSYGQMGKDQDEEMDYDDESYNFR